MANHEKKRHGFAFLFLIAVGMLTVGFFIRRETQDEEGTSSEPVVAVKNDPTHLKDPVVLSPDFEWSDQDEAWFEDLMEQVGTPTGNGQHWEYSFEETLAPGESLVTDGWEVSEGVFQFTTLTPTEVTSGDETHYQISAEVTQIDLSGDAKTLFMPRVITRNQMSAIIEVVHSADESTTSERSYRLEVTPEGVAEGIKLGGTVSASEGAAAE